MAEYIDDLLPQKELSLATHTRSFVIYSEFLLAINSETKGVTIFFLSRQSKYIFLRLLFLSIQFCFFNSSMVLVSKHAYNCLQGLLRFEIIYSLLSGDGVFFDMINCISFGHVVSTYACSPLVMIKGS